MNVAVLLALMLGVFAMSQPFGFLDPRAHEIVVGVPGSGKTTLARERVAGAWRVVFFDPVGDYEKCGEPVTPVEFEENAQSLLAGTVSRVVVQADRDPDIEVHEEFAAVVLACRKHAGPGLVLVADEVGDYGLRASEVLTRLHRNGHHDGVASILVSQCAVDIPLTCRRTATRVTSLLQVRAEDLEALARDYGEVFADAARAWRPGSTPAVWSLPTLYHER